MSQSNASTSSTALPVRIAPEAQRRRAQRQVDGGVVLEERRRAAQLVERRDDVFGCFGSAASRRRCSIDRPRHRMLERARRQHQLLRLALAVLIDAVDRLEPDDHRQPGPGVRRQVEIAGVIDLGRAGGRSHQLDPLDPSSSPNPLISSAMLVTP